MHDLASIINLASRRVSEIGGVAALRVSWIAPSDPGYSEGTDASHTDNEITAYDARYIRSDATDEQKADDSNWTLVEDIWTAPGPGEDADPLQYRITGLQNGVSYDVQARAETQAGVSPWTATGAETPTTLPVYTVRTDNPTLTEGVSSEPLLFPLYPCRCPLWVKSKSAFQAEGLSTPLLALSANSTKVSWLLPLRNR